MFHCGRFLFWKFSHSRKKDALTEETTKVSKHLKKISPTTDEQMIILANSSFLNDLARIHQSWGILLRKPILPYHYLINNSFLTQL